MLDRLQRIVRGGAAAAGSGAAAAANGDAPHVVIVGAGFAGLHAARELVGAEQTVRVTLIDRNNYHKFQPLLYQVATAGLDPNGIAHSVRDVFHYAANVDFKLGAVTDIDADRRRVATREGLETPYDYLVLAAGAVASYFGVEGAREHSFPLKNLSDAVQLRNHILRQFERADQRVHLSGDDQAQDGPLRFVVVGGGPTGVETAGALTELFRVMQRDYKRFDTTAAEVMLVEMGDRLLPAYDPEQSAYTRRVLSRRGVQVMTGAAVERVEPGAVHFESGRRLATETLIWGAGVAASPVAGLVEGAEQADGGRLAVGPDLRVDGRERIFAVGDIGAGENDEGRLYAQLAPVAIQQGKHAARQALRLAQGRPAEPFAYRNLGKMATIGRNAAVAELPGGVRLEGFVAWVAWVFIHIAKLVGTRNRASVFVEWIYNYFTYDRSARLILPDVQQEREEESAPAAEA